MMPVQFILSQYLAEAMASATYGKLEDGTFGNGIPACTGVIAFGTTLWERELRSTLEDWVLVGLKLGHPLPGPPRDRPQHPTHP